MNGNEFNLNTKYFSELDIHFARFLAELSKESVPEIMLAGALVSRFTREGHICLDLPTVEGRPLYVGGHEGDVVVCPELKRWSSLLIDSRVVGRPGDYKPLILDHRSRLYLYRYWDHEKVVTDYIKDHAGMVSTTADIDRAGECLARLFPSHPEDGGPDWAKIAAATAFLKRFAVICGSPGTGKTTVVVRLLALLIELSERMIPRIALAAPTGKAAFRLQEAVRKNREGLSTSGAVKAAIPGDAATIHRLLGSSKNSPHFRFNRENRLPYDLVVIDEASMVDLPLMSKLADALPRDCRLILLGDRDQLSSVEAGAVLGDICGMGEQRTYSTEAADTLGLLTGYEIPKEMVAANIRGVQDSIVELKKNFRFHDASGISRVCREVNAGHGEEAMNILRSGTYDDVSWLDSRGSDTLPSYMRQMIKSKFKDYLKCLDFSQYSENVLDFLEEFRILCAVRSGPFGVLTLNRIVEDVLDEAKIIRREGEWYNGRPIMIIRNDYNLRLWNGDVGVILRDSDNILRAFFRDSGSGIRRFSPIALPEHETVFAMTVHKSQGSEFENVLFILPESDSPVLTRELIYTGITRARRNVAVLGSEGIFRTAVSRRIIRTSGLYDALYSH